MKRRFAIVLLTTISILAAGHFLIPQPSLDTSDIIYYEVDVQQQDLRLYWKNEQGALFKSLGNLKEWTNIRGEQLLFAMNGGMFNSTYAPQGLFIQEGKVLTPLDTTHAEGNFYLKPIGVLFITTSRKAFIRTTESFTLNNNILYATQSGPMLLIGGRHHPAFKKGSANTHIRNGVGIKGDGKLLFVMTKKKVNFYDFATYIKEMGCRDALYLDGFVSRTYLPEKNWIQTDGAFGVIIGVTSPLQEDDSR